MTTYVQSRDADQKDLVVFYDFEDLQVRFSSGRSTIAAPAGWTEFLGAQPRRDSGSALDIRKGKLSIGSAGFTVPDVGGAISAWLKTADASLSGAAVIRKSGFVGVPENEYRVSRWVVADYKVDGRRGGGFEFELRSVLRELTRPLFEDFEVEDYQLEQTGTPVNLASSATTIRLEESPKGIWREPGFAVLWDEDARKLELVSYATIGGAGNQDLQTVTRRLYAFGDVFTFLEERTQVAQVWARRGHPFDIMLELATSSGAAGASSPAEVIANPQLDDWTTGAPDNWTAVTTGGTVDEIAGQSGAGSAARIERTGAGELALAKITGAGASQDSGLLLTPGKWYVLSFCYRLNEVRDGTANSLRVSIKNNTAGESLQADGTFAVANYNRQLPAASADVWYPDVTPFLVDAGFGAGDFWRINWSLSGPIVALPIADVDGIRGAPFLIGPFDSEPTGPFDLGEDGLGVSWSYFDVLTLAKIRDEVPIEAPVFDGSDQLTAGAAVLFVEKEPIRDLKVWIEKHLLLPYALFPALDGEERLGAEIYYRVGLMVEEIGDAWDKTAFSASSWRRNFDDRTNILELQSDYNPAASKPELSRLETQETSIARYGKSKPLKVEARGHRTGVLGSPDYSGQAVNDLLDRGRTILLELANAPTEVNVRAFYRFRDLTIGQTIAINVPGVPDIALGVQGMTGKLFQVVRRRIDDAAGRVDFRIRERRPVTRPALVAPASQRGIAYTGSTEAQKQYCALTPGSSPNFANGDEGYTVP